MPNTRAALRTLYPSPARQRATVEYTLPERQWVTVKAYDVLGRKVASLATGEKEAEVHQATLDASQLPSETYFARMRANGQTRAQRLSVVR